MEATQQQVVELGHRIELQGWGTVFFFFWWLGISKKVEGQPRLQL